MKFKNLISLIIPILLIALMSSIQESKAQSSTTLTDPLIPGALSSPPNIAPPPGSLPPIGDGTTPIPEIINDAAPPPPVPSGTAQVAPVAGNVFPQTIGNDRTLVYVYRMDRSLRMVQTIRPDQLSANAIAQVNGILGINMLSGQPYIQVVASNGQIAEVNQVLAPYPNAIIFGGRTAIVSDNPAANYPKPGEANRYVYQGPLPTVATFGRYLVIMGVASATIFMALASYSIVSGNQYGGARVIGAASGLILLLMAYTIWKLVQMNTFNPIASFTSMNNSRPYQALVPTTSLGGAGTPVVPTAPAGLVPRSGVPLQPLGGSFYP